MSYVGACLLALAHLSVALDEVFVGGELGQCHGASGMQLLSRYANLGSEAKLRPIGKGRRDVGIHASRIDTLLEALQGGRIFAHDSFAVV